MEKTDNKNKNRKAGNAAKDQKTKSPSAVSDAKPASSASTATTPLDYVLWTVVALGLAGAVGLNYYFSQPESLQPVTTRLPIVIGCVVVAAVCALCTTLGRRLIKFAKSSRGELRKVTWPTKDETVKSTVGVAVVAIIVAFLLWVFDVVIGFLVSLITNA